MSRLLCPRRTKRCVCCLDSGLSCRPLLAFETCCDCELESQRVVGDVRCCDDSCLKEEG